MSPPPPVTELTPTLIAKAQKHCRFAISALDYEDAEQAKKELRSGSGDTWGMIVDVFYFRWSVRSFQTVG